MSELMWVLQLALDAVLLAGLGFLFWRLHGRRGQDLRHVSPQDLESFVAEASQLSREFERILSEKRELIGSTLTSLDSRLARLREMAAQLERTTPQPAPAAPASAAQPAPEPQGFRASVLDLARRGQTPAQIAQALGRPLGEVELVLQLHKR